MKLMWTSPGYECRVAFPRTRVHSVGCLNRDLWDSRIAKISWILLDFNYTLEYNTLEYNTLNTFTESICVH